MKQQEILRKIGNILKELNDQYDYLQAEEAHTNDLELELFAANAKFLTDHTEILRKINAQIQNVRLTLPEHHEAEAAQLQLPVAETESNNHVTEPAEEILLSPLAESAITYEPFTKTEPEPAVAEHYQEPVQEEFTFHPVVEQEPEPQISIEPEKEYDSYNYVRHEPEVSSNNHSFSISSHTEEEPAPPHIDLTPSEPEPEPIVTPFAVEPEPVQTYYTTPELQEAPKVEETEQQPVFKHEAYAPVETEQTEPVQIPLTEPEPEPVAIAPVEDIIEKRYVFTQTIEVPEPNTFEQVTSNYTPPVTEVPKPEQPLTLNERLSAQLRPNTVTSSPVQQTQAITDIKSAISLNDKMLFVKDLFNGYSLAYSEAIELVNRCKSFDEADRFLKSNYVTKNNWIGKPDTVDKFYAILHRRFTA